MYNNLSSIRGEGVKEKTNITRVNIKGGEDNGFSEVKEEARGVTEKVKSDKHMPEPPKKIVEVEGDVVGEGAKCAVSRRNVEIKKANKGVNSKGKEGA